MVFVLDASTALNLVLPEESATTASMGVAESFRGGETAVVPSLWLLEVANVLLVCELRGRIAEGDSERLLAKLLTLPISIAQEAFGGVQRTYETLTLAREQKLSAYDGAYLWLARSQGIALATDDKAVVRAAEQILVPVLGSRP